MHTCGSASRHPTPCGLAERHIALAAGRPRISVRDLHAVANTPAGPMETCSLIRFHRPRPSPNRRRVGPCITLFEAWSPFTHVRACMLAKSPIQPSTPKASATFVDLDGNTIRNCPGAPPSQPSPLVTAANYATLGFSGGIVPKTTVTHTPNTCHLTIPIVNATTYTLCNNLLDQNYQILNISASSFAATTCTTAPRLR